MVWLNPDRVFTKPFNDALDRHFGKSGVASENGKKVLWLVDWHRSRLSYAFLCSMCTRGVIIMGWTPAPLQGARVEM